MRIPKSQWLTRDSKDEVVSIAKEEMTRKGYTIEPYYDLKYIQPDSPNSLGSSKKEGEEERNKKIQLMEDFGEDLNFISASSNSDHDFIAIKGSNVLVIDVKVAIKTPGFVGYDENDNHWRFSNHHFRTESVRGLKGYREPDLYMVWIPSCDGFITVGSGKFKPNGSGMKHIPPDLIVKKFGK